MNWAISFPGWNSSHCTYNEWQAPSLGLQALGSPDPFPTSFRAKPSFSALLPYWCHSLGSSNVRRPFQIHGRHPAAWNALHWLVPSSVQLQRHLFREAFPDRDPTVSSLFSQSVLALLHCAHLPEFIVIYLLISLFTVSFPHSVLLCEISGTIISTCSPLETQCQAHSRSLVNICHWNEQCFIQCWSPMLSML